MAKSRSISLDTRAFEKAGEAMDFFSTMLNRHNLGDRVNDKDALDLAALLKLHSEYVEKLGVGIDHFEVRKPPTDVPQFSGRCFWIVRTDGSQIDFSFKHCLAPKK